jgi:hypothetical protein
MGLKLIHAIVLAAVLIGIHSEKSFSNPDPNVQKQLKVTRVSPSGLGVTANSQIVFEFNRPVVPVGRMERDKDDIPVTITPATECQWRWLNTTSLACNLSDDNRLKEATQYRIIMQPGIVAEDGATISAPFTHEFITQRPYVRYARFSNWTSPGTPVVRLTFNRAVSQSSVAKHIAFSYSNEQHKRLAHPVEVTKDPNDRNNPRYILVPGESYILDTGEDNSKSTVDDSPTPMQGELARRVWLVSPVEPLPLDTQINLTVSPGLVSAFGEETGIEIRIVTQFHTFPEFEFIGISCTQNNGTRITITAENSDLAKKCNPLRGSALSFSAPVANSQVKDHILFEPSLAGNRTDYDPWANLHDYSKLRQAHKQGDLYNVWLPEHLQAAQQYLIKTKVADLSTIDTIKSWFSEVRSTELKDEFGRPLAAPIDFSFLTDHRLPDFELAHRVAVLEKQIDSDVPLYVTNLDEVTFDYTLLNTEGTQTEQFLSTDIDKIQDVQFAVPMQIRTMLQQKSGAVYGTIDTQPGLQKHQRQRSLFATVSPYQLHVKLGHFNTLVWVTDLATDQPVQGAKVRIYQDSMTRLASVFDAMDTAMTDNSGLALLKGRVKLDPNLQLSGWCADKPTQDQCERLFVRVDSGSDIAIMPLEHRFDVSVYRASNYQIWDHNKKQHGHIHSWGTTAQGIYRAGNTIQYKLYVRDQDNTTYIPAPKQHYRLSLIDPMGKTVEEVKDIVLSEFGSYSGEYRLPDNAAMGWYRFELEADFTDDYTWHPMRVLVTDFTPASFKITNSLNGDRFLPQQSIEVTSSATLYSGGAYTDAETRVTATLQSAYFSSDHPLAQGFSFDTYKNRRSKQLFQTVDNLDSTGNLKHRFSVPKEEIVFGRLRVESAVRDERGKYISAVSSADYMGVDRLVGLKQTHWLYEQGKLSDIHYLVVDESGDPAPDTQVEITIERLEIKTAKVKGAGNAYTNNYVEHWLASDTCQGVSRDTPLTCSFTPQQPGTYNITASIQDTQGNTHSTEMRS